MLGAADEGEWLVEEALAVGSLSSPHPESGYSIWKSKKARR